MNLPTIVTDAYTAVSDSGDGYEVYRTCPHRRGDIVHPLGYVVRLFTHWGGPPAGFAFTPGSDRWVLNAYEGRTLDEAIRAGLASRGLS